MSAYKFSDYDRRWGKPALRDCSMDGCDRGGKITRGMCDYHYRKWLRDNRDQVRQIRDDRPALERVMSRTSIDPDSGCWVWQLSVQTNGYPTHVYTSEGGRRGHVWAYELLVGPVPEGMELDHTCHWIDENCVDMGHDCPHRRCVNPSHLEPVTRRVNVLRSRSWASRNARKTHCPQGHEYTPENTYVHNGSRQCKTCRRERKVRARATS